MDNETKGNWVVVFEGSAAAQNIKILNLDQIRIVDQISHDHVRLCFSETNAIELTGKSAGQLARLLISRGIDVNGIAMPEFSDISILDQWDQQS
jgi:hypothetical protein